MPPATNTGSNAAPIPKVPESGSARAVLVALRRIIRATDLHSRTIGKTTGLTVPQLVVLQAVAELGEVTSGRIAAGVSLSQGTVTVILDRLEDKGLIRRYRSQVDRRIVHSALTPDGRQQLDRAPPLLHVSFMRRFKALPDAQRRRIEAALDEVASMMDAGDLDAAPLLDVGRPDRAG
jgi:DNA-binding MarR family transcriptional regulator